MSRVRRFATALAVALLAPRGAALLPVAAGAQARPVRADSAASPPDGAPVIIRLDTVLVIPTRLGSFTARELAAAVADRVRRASSSGADSVELVPSETSTDLVAGDVILMTVTDADAATLGRPRAQVAADFATRLAAQLRVVSKAETVKTALLGVLYTALATGVLYALLLALGRPFPRLYAYVEALRPRMPSIRIQTLEIVSSSVLTDAVRTAIAYVRIGLVIVLFYVYLPLVFSFFPWTQPLSGRLVGYALQPLRQVGAGVSPPALPTL